MDKAEIDRLYSFKSAPTTPVNEEVPGPGLFEAHSLWLFHRLCVQVSQTVDKRGLVKRVEKRNKP